MPAPLGAAVAAQSAALAGLASGRSSSGAWSDAQRTALDRARLDPLEQDGRRLLAAMRQAQQQIDLALRQLG